MWDAQLIPALFVRCPTQILTQHRLFELSLWIDLLELETDNWNRDKLGKKKIADCRSNLTANPLGEFWFHQKPACETSLSFSLSLNLMLWLPMFWLTKYNVELSMHVVDIHKSHFCYDISECLYLWICTCHVGSHHTQNPS